MMFRLARISTVSALCLLTLSACEEGQGVTPRDAADPGTPAAVARSEIRDVERPDIFSTTELGLWDGRPSLGGIWIAHPDVAEPERALIRNTTNGQKVAGALFRRERSNPGPRIQVSSDAATALNMLAGQPTELEVIVVRQEEIVIEPAPLPVSEEVVGEEATLEASDRASGQTADPAGISDKSDSEVALAGAAAIAAADKPARPGFWGRFRNSLRNEPAKDAAQAPMIAETADDASAPDVETAPLDPVTTAAAAAIATAEASPAPPRPTPAAAPAPAESASGLRNPYIQIGLFSLEENADAAAASLRQAGIVPSVDPTTTNGKSFWRVLVGPLTSADDQAALLDRVKDLGYSDAYLTAN
jgi:peptidoglycan lytic transglycosylase